MAYGVVLFHTTSSVMRAEKLLIKAGCAIKLIPTPRQFSSDCGIAIRFYWSECESIRALLVEARVEVQAMHQM